MNIFKLPDVLPNEELFEKLIDNNNITIERIISTGQVSPENFWYDQDMDEWVVLLQGEASLIWRDGRSRDLFAGDYVLIPAHDQHRIEKTSITPPCIWLAVHGNFDNVF